MQQRGPARSWGTAARPAASTDPRAYGCGHAKGACREESKRIFRIRTPHGGVPPACPLKPQKKGYPPKKAEAIETWGENWKVPDSLELRIGFPLLQEPGVQIPNRSKPPIWGCLRFVAFELETPEQVGILWFPSNHPPTKD